MKFVFVFFFKQKTAYEMRISDWSSDVCSSDLIAAEADEDLRGPVEHRRHRFHRVMAMFARRLEPEHVAHAIEIGRGRLFIHAHSAIALDVRMPADRPDTRAELAGISLEQQQLGDLLNTVPAFPELGEPQSMTVKKETM